MVNPVEAQPGQDFSPIWNSGEGIKPPSPPKVGCESTVEKNSSPHNKLFSPQHICKSRGREPLPPLGFAIWQELKQKVKTARFCSTCCLKRSQRTSEKMQVTELSIQ